jgi:tRNA(Ile)-lysidine synthase
MDFIACWSVISIINCAEEAAPLTPGLWKNSPPNGMQSSITADIRQLAKDNRRSIETAARHARYAFFAATAAATGCKSIFLAHHADDQVETFLFNLFRGAGMSGLSGMQEAVIRQVEGRPLRILRPLLPVWRKDIDAYLQAHQLQFREDKSNRSLLPVRNRLRHSMISELEREFGREIKKTILRTAAILTEENDFLLSQTPPPELELSLKKLRPLPIALQRRLIHAWLGMHQVRDVGFEEIEQIRSLIQPGAVSAKMNLPGNRHVRRKEGWLFISDELPRRKDAK